MPYATAKRVTIEFPCPGLARRCSAPKVYRASQYDTHMHSNIRSTQFLLHDYNLEKTWLNFSSMVLRNCCVYTCGEDEIKAFRFFFFLQFVGRSGADNDRYSDPALHSIGNSGVHGDDMLRAQVIQPREILKTAALCQRQSRASYALLQRHGWVKLTFTSVVSIFFSFSFLFFSSYSINDEIECVRDTDYIPLRNSLS